MLSIQLLQNNQLEKMDWKNETRMSFFELMHNMDDGEEFEFECKRKSLFEFECSDFKFLKFKMSPKKNYQKLKSKKRIVNSSA